MEKLTKLTEQQLRELDEYIAKLTEQQQRELDEYIVNFYVFSMTGIRNTTPRFNWVEQVRPQGSFSMCPILSADNHNK